MTRRPRLRPALLRAGAWTAALAVSIVFLFPYAWMLSSAFRSTARILAAPLHLWPEHFDLSGFRAIADAGGVSLLRASVNSVAITGLSTALAVLAAALGAYAIRRRPRNKALLALRGGFLLTMVYPAMLLVIPVYIVMYRIGLLGSYTGIVLFLSLGPVPFFLFDQFFRSLPEEVIEAATVDGAGEAQILFRVVMPMARPVVATVAIITFLLNWAQWFPVLVISSSPATYTLPVALLNLNGELGVNFQGIMALAVISYIDFHVTNYSLGALEMLDAGRAPVLDFAMPYLAPLTLKAWLADRDLRDPWQEGNNIVNLGSFLLLMRQHGLAPEAEVEQALGILFDWHDRHQEPATGFWGVGQLSDPLAALHAMAGSMHNFHLWYATARPLLYQDRAVDYALAQPAEVSSACIDVDLVDLLVHAHMTIGHRAAETEDWLRRKLVALLDFQAEDGGFPDEMAGERRQDGWVRGYVEPQGLSNTFATWFRWIAIAMIADLLWPGWRPWRFRRMIGIGYRREPAA